jgi:hypothetical protein
MSLCLPFKPANMSLWFLSFFTTPEWLFQHAVSAKKLQLILFISTLAISAFWVRADQRQSSAGYSHISIFPDN